MAVPHQYHVSNTPHTSSNLPPFMSSKSCTPVLTGQTRPSLVYTLYQTLPLNSVYTSSNLHPFVSSKPCTPILTCQTWPSLVYIMYQILLLRLKKKKVWDSLATFCKNRWGRQVFFFFFYFPPKQMRQLFFFNPVKIDLKFKCKQKWKVCVICILPGLRLLGHAAGTSLGFMFRVGTGFMQQTLCNTQMLGHSSDTMRHAVKIINLSL